VEDLLGPDEYLDLLAGGNEQQHEPDVSEEAPE
jgi:hypothetical protein